jgi:hypothetical protein
LGINISKNSGVTVIPLAEGLVPLANDDMTEWMEASIPLADCIRHNSVRYQTHPIAISSISTKEHIEAL